MNKNNDIETRNICNDLSQFSDAFKAGNKDMSSVLEELQKGPINSVYSAMSSFVAAAAAQRAQMAEEKRRILESRRKAENEENNSSSNSAYSDGEYYLR